MSVKGLIIFCIVLMVLAGIGGCKRKPVSQAQDANAVAKAQEDLRLAKAQITELRKKYEDARGRAVELGSEIDKSRKLTTSLNSEISKLKKELAKAQSERNDLRENIARLEKDLATITTACSEARKKISQAAPKQTAIAKAGDESGIITYKEPQTTVNQEPGTKTAAQQDDPYKARLIEADSYIQGGNWTAAEQILNEISAANPNYPGLDALRSRIANVKAQRQQIQNAPHGR